jgi:C-terminal processing protease CtpA/Prc
VLVTVNSRQKRGMRQRTIKKQSVSLGPVTLKFLTITVLALLTLVYLIQSTKGSTKQIHISRLEDKKEMLQTEREEIELESVRLKSLQQIKAATDMAGFEAVKNPENLSKVQP